MSLAASPGSLDLTRTAHQESHPEDSPDSHPLISGKLQNWSWELFIGAWVVAALWLTSWTWGPTRQIWNAIDVAVFRLANASISEPTIWRTVAAGSNARLFDVVAFAATACLLVYCAAGRGRKWREETLSIILLLLAIGVAKFVIADLVLDKSCHFRRASPTLTLQAVRLSEVERWVQTKDSSRYCFPSDHGAVLLAVAFYALLRSPRKAGLAFGLAALFTLPRIISGAHWVTDIVIGSAFVAFAGVSILVMTPLHDRAIQALSLPWKRHTNQG